MWISCEKIGPLFVNAGGTSSLKSRRSLGILPLVSNWVLLFDLDRQLKFPSHIFSTRLRPDFVIYCDTSKILLIIELTCPCEDNIQYWNLEKTSKYASLITECKKRGWFVHFFCSGGRG